MREIVSLEGVVLRQYDFDENNMKLCLFTDKLGKITVYAKGARDPKNSNHAGCLCYCYSSFEIIKSGSGASYTLSSARPISYFYYISQQVEAFALASYFSQCITMTFPDEMPDKEAFSMLLNSLHALSIYDFRPLEQIKASFEFILCRILGFCPDLYHCCVCGKEHNSSKTYNFSFEESSVICDDCFEKMKADEKQSGTVKRTRVIYSGTMEALRYISNSTVKRFLLFNTTKDCLWQLLSFCEVYFFSVADYNFDTLRYYKKLFI